MSGVRRNAGPVGGDLRLRGGKSSAAYRGARRHLHCRRNRCESAAQAEKWKIRRCREAQGKARIVTGANYHPGGVERGVPAARRRVGGLEESLVGDGPPRSVNQQLRTRGLTPTGFFLPRPPGPRAPPPPP